MATEVRICDDAGNGSKEEIEFEENVRQQKFDHFGLPRQRILDVDDVPFVRTARRRSGVNLIKLVSLVTDDEAK